MSTYSSLWCQGIPQRVLLKFGNGLDLFDEEIMKEIDIPLNGFLKTEQLFC